MEFVTFEIAKKLKEKGFKEECLSYYTTEYTLYNNVITTTDDKYLCVSDIDYEEFLISHNSIKYTNGNYVDAPTIEQVLKWLRDNYSIHLEISVGRFAWYFSTTNYEYYEEEKVYDFTTTHVSDSWDSYEEAALAGIEYVLDNLI